MGKPERDVAAAAERIHQREFGMPLLHRAPRGAGGLVGEIRHLVKMNVGWIAAEHRVGLVFGPVRERRGHRSTSRLRSICPHTFCPGGISAPLSQAVMQVPLLSFRAAIQPQLESERESGAAATSDFAQIVQRMPERITEAVVDNSPWPQRTPHRLVRLSVPGS